MEDAASQVMATGNQHASNMKRQASAAVSQVQDMGNKMLQGLQKMVSQEHGGGRRRRRTMKHKRSAKRRRHSGPAYGGKRKRRSTRRRRNH